MKGSSLLGSSVEVGTPEVYSAGAGAKDTQTLQEMSQAEIIEEKT